MPILLSFLSFKRTDQLFDFLVGQTIYHVHFVQIVKQNIFKKMGVVWRFSLTFRKSSKISDKLVCPFSLHFKISIAILGKNKSWKTDKTFPMDNHMFNIQNSS